MQITYPSERIDLTTKENRCHAAQLVTNLFDRWGLDNNTCLNLLGMNESSRSVLLGYKDGTRPLPSSRDTFDRVGFLLAIHKSLRLLYPRNENQRYSWISSRNAVFDNLTPLDVMKESGIIGIARVSRYLDYYSGLK